MEFPESFCWLTNKIEDISDIPHFSRNIKSIQKFRLLWQNLLPNEKFTTQSFIKFYSIFTDELKNNWSSYNFNILKPSKAVKTQTKLSSDIKRTIGKHRTDHRLVVKQSIDIDGVLQMFSQMLIFIDKKITKYMQGFCDILIPIFHIFTQGLLAINDSFEFTIGDPSLYVCEEYKEQEKSTYNYILTMSCSCTCFAFEGLMLNQINYIEQFPPINRVEQSMIILREKLRMRHEFSSFMNQEEFSPSRFAAKWFLLLFTQDLKFNDVVELICELVKSDSVFESSSFTERVIKACECAAICNYKNADDKGNIHFIEIMQQTQNLTFADMKKVALMLK